MRIGLVADGRAEVVDEEDAACGCSVFATSCLRRSIAAGMGPEEAGGGRLAVVEDMAELKRGWKLWLEAG